MLPRAPSARLFPGSHALAGRQFSSRPGAAHRGTGSPPLAVPTPSSSLVKLDAIFTLCCWYTCFFSKSPLTVASESFCHLTLNPGNTKLKQPCVVSFYWIPSSLRHYDYDLGAMHLPCSPSVPECFLRLDVIFVIFDIFVQLDVIFLGTTPLVCLGLASVHRSVSPTGYSLI